MKTLYFDCFSGASGNMIIGALLSLGVDREDLVEQLSRLGLPSFDLAVSTVDRAGISALHVDVVVPHEHAHRRLSDIEEIIEASDLSHDVKDRSISIFTALAEAEAKVHGTDVESVHFHEVGGLDAVIDIVGACIGFEMLGIERFACSKINVGSGFVDMAHGRFPVPPPAVSELLSGLPIYSADIEGELITPTGAAIIATMCDSYGPIPELMLEGSGYGAGSREYAGFPNVLRALVGASAKAVEHSGTARMHLDLESDQLTLIETNIDDLSPQVLGYVMDRAFELGALDCWFTPIQMKKNRPATMVAILCDEAKREDLCALLYRETSTLGVRVRATERECLIRETIGVETEYGTIDVKVARFRNSIVNIKPEFDQLREIAIRSESSLLDIERKIVARVQDSLKSKAGKTSA